MPNKNIFKFHSNYFRLQNKSQPIIKGLNMDSEQISKILRSNEKTARIFKGCFPCDLMPNPSHLNYPAALVVNLDSHQLKGSHWIAIYAYGEKREVIYFDSLALPVNSIIEEKFLNKFSRALKNKKPYQSIVENTCGQHCICFIYFLSLGYTFNEYIKYLEGYPKSCDLFVRKFMNKMITYLSKKINYFTI
uniref:Uncharacterized protein n=1 Tax=Meloidogyne enterolobii TaxID=390850 RepID=A0A6V7UJI4_MELEN|nr:unnamed protein product [Meloidogyne enterolobii]